MTALIPSSSADVVLFPGVKQGTVSFTGETISEVQVSAYSYDNDNFSGWGVFPGNTYSLTLEGDHAYTSTVYTRFAGVGTSNYLYISTSSPVTVPFGQTVVENFVYNAARIHANVNVLGGTVANLELNASADEAGEGYFTYVYQDASASLSFPMILDSSVKVWGVARLNLADGSQTTVALTPTMISHGASGTNVDWTIDTSTLAFGALQANFNVSEPGGPDIIGSHQIYLYGINGQTSGVSRSASFTSNGAQSITSLVPGDYWAYGYTYFDAPYGYYYHPTQIASIPAGGTASHDFSGSLGFLTSTAFLYGFRYTESTSGGQIRLTRADGGTGYDWMSTPSGQLDLALPSGVYKNDYYYFYFYEPDPVAPLNAGFYRYDAPSPPITVTAGFHALMDPISIMNVEAKIIFDVFEPPGSTGDTLITAPRCFGRTLEGHHLQAYGSNTSSGKQILRLIGEPGTYEMDAYATVNGTETSFGHFPMTLAEPQYIAPIFPGPVEPMPGVSLTFTAVTAEGYITATSSPIGPQPPEGLKLLTDPPLYYDIMTTGEFTPPVTVCMTYDDFAAESDIRMMHFDESVMDWVDVTTTVDTALNQVCGSTPSFSIFALMASEPTEGGDPEPEDDPCPSAVGELCPLVQSMSLHAGTTQSLCAKAQAAAAASSSQAATNALNAFVNAVGAQRGKKIPEDAAQLLITCATKFGASPP